MGDYYKIKKILLILIIVLTIIRIFKTSNVFASEAVEVTPVWNDGDYTYQSDNQYLTLRQNQIDQQDALITFFYNMLSTGNDTQISNAKNTLTNIKQFLVTSVPGQTYWGGNETKFIWFGRVTTSINGTNNYGYCYQILPIQLMGSSNIVYHDATLNSGYKILSVPFYEFERANPRPIRYVNVSDGTYYSVTTGTASCPVAEVGCYSTRWVGVFQAYGLLQDTSDYNDLLASIEETNELNYTQNYYTKQAVQNTYSYLTNDNIEEITSLGISQPQVNEQVDLTSVLDSLEALLTNETYTTKFFTITLPNGRGSTFALSPELLENNLTRVGGQNIVSIIHACWYIGLYGWYIFSLLAIYGKLLTGDLFHLVKGCSPVTNLVKMSVGTISGGKF